MRLEHLLVKKHLVIISTNVIVAFAFCLFIKANAGWPVPMGERADGYELVFEDHFNGNQLDTARWSIPPRGNSTWSRWISKDKRAIEIKKGKLTCRALPNKDRSQDSATMLTGAIWTKDKFAFKYGRVEVRMRTNLQPGNFPAAWMGRQWGKGNVPPYGEIDIVEMVGNDRKARHAFHTEHTTKTSKHGIKNSFMEQVEVNKWHIYAIEWTPEYIHWSVDGKITGRHHKPKTGNVQNEWTFDVPFYLLLNQSIMHGVYGIKADLDKTYETQFDWIKVYQKLL